LNINEEDSFLDMVWDRLDLCRCFTADEKPPQYHENMATSAAVEGDLVWGLEPSSEELEADSTAGKGKGMGCISRIPHAIGWSTREARKLLPPFLRQSESHFRMIFTTPLPLNPDLTVFSE
jgi:hypothetical protein